MQRDELAVVASHGHIFIFHYGVTAVMEISSLSQLFCEEVAGIDDAWNMFDLGKTKLMGLFIASLS